MLHPAGAGFSYGFAGVFDSRSGVPANRRKTLKRAARAGDIFRDDKAD
jgi:hypothetical protein